MLFLRLITSIATGILLFRLVRRAAADRALSVIVITGFLARAFAGIALFWISYLRLPIAKGLQMGEGLWFFALDALQYYPQALAAAHKGVVAIAAIPRTSASVSFVQVLAASLMLFGDSAATAVLLNLLCYGATCAVLVTWLGREASARAPATVAVAAVSFAPSSILWCAQPLKDTFFQFIIVAFIAACALWQRRWRELAGPAALAAPAAVMVVTLSAIAGVRWYFAFALLIASAGFALLLPLTIPTKRIAAAAASIGLVFVMSRTFLFVAQPYIPPAVDGALEPWHVSKAAVTAVPQTLTNGIVTARRGFEASGGATQIHSGGEIATLDAKRPAPRPVERKPLRLRAAEKRDHRRAPARAAADAGAQLAQNNSSEAAAPVSVLPRSTAPPQPSVKAEVQPASASVSPPPPPTPRPARQHDTAPVTVAAAPVATARAKTPTAPAIDQRGLSADHSHPAAAAEVPPPMMSAAERPAASTRPAAMATPEPQTAADHSRTKADEGSRAADVSPTQSRESHHRTAAAKGAKTAKTEEALQTTVTTPVAPAPAAPALIEQPARIAASSSAHARRASTPQVNPPPPSHVARFLTGAAAVLVPRALAQRLGIFHIAGGRGMWWFSELDTLFFDLVIACAVALLLRSRTAAVMNPMFWLVLLALLLVGVPLVYAVTNFGTLFRLRGMLLTTVALLPAVVAADPGAFFRFRRSAELIGEA